MVIPVGAWTIVRSIRALRCTAPVSVVVCLYGVPMRRAYIESHCSLIDSFKLARRWADGAATSLIAPSTSAVEASPWLESAGVPIGTVGNRHSRFNAPPHGVVIAWCLHLDELLDLEDRNDIDAVVLVRAGVRDAPWITAYEVDHLGGEAVPEVEEASPTIRATVEGLSGGAVLNQGLIDSRERSAAVQALTYLRERGHELDPDQLATEALRCEWPRRAPLELAQIARDLNAGKKLKFQQRLRPEILAEWANVSAPK